MNRRGITLLELMIAVVVVTVTVGAATRAFLSGLGYEAKLAKTSDAEADRTYLEDSMATILRGIRLGRDGYLVSPVPGLGSPTTGLGGSSSVAFTSVSQELPTRFGTDTNSDWEELNQRYGAQGGPAEIAFSLTPAGDAGEMQGLFQRRQTPPDAEPGRGGRERLLDGRVKDLRFEFLQSSDWRDAWDSRDGDQKGKLPSAIRVTYRLTDETRPRSFLVRLLMGGTS
jgi:hypothetical protein